MTSKLYFIVLFIVASFVSFFVVNTPETFAARCFTEVRNWDDNGKLTDDYFISQAPSCSREMGSAGYRLDGLPNPFPSDDNTCYYWTRNTSAIPQTVNCSDSRFANAPVYGNKPDGRLNRPEKEELKDINNTSVGQSNIDEYLATGVNILTAVAGLAITGSIVVGGLQYASAGGNASQVSTAKNRLFVSIASLLMLGFGYALLQWLIPGGIFK